MSKKPPYLRALLLSLGVLFAASLLLTQHTFAAAAGSGPDAAAPTETESQSDPNETIEAVDWSMFQPPHTADDMQRLKDAGIGLIVVGSWHGDALGMNENCGHDLALAREAGIKTAIYVVVDGPDGTKPEDAVLKGLAACGPEAANAQFIALDAEVDSTTPELLKKAAYIVRMFRKEAILYTGRWFWEDVIGNPQEACDLPLWNALYDYNPDFSFKDYPYGCWTPDQVVGEQYSNESRFEGMEMDHNSFKVSFMDGISVKAAATPPPTTTTALSTLTATPKSAVHVSMFSAFAKISSSPPATQEGASSSYPCGLAEKLDVFAVASSRAASHKCTDAGHP